VRAALLPIRDGADRPSGRITTPLLLRAGGIGLFVGIATAYAQGWLPDEVASLANSAGPWMLVAFLAAIVARRPLDGALSAVSALIAMLVGYSAAIEVRGFEHSSRSIAFWGLAAIVVGPPIGVSASWVRFGRLTSPPSAAPFRLGC
jgi:uncharacterized protein DUF6518